ncbi:SDR family oxidoreductase [Mycolicibacterium sp. GF69]|uniref:SDR family oxidoreductase n=1 Tax=Mycolicibacterium sp. GF69 TaxID=2267251 RepID=UPI001403354E|nr:SDR family NAD(P)-dependent oxidoreductase [Mycolicibacterium sp. GF69]
MSTAEVVLVTGGGSGIGGGLASAFHARGHQVIVVGHRRERVEAVAARHPGMCWQVADVADAEEVAALAEEVGCRWPGLTTVINNAGVQHLFDFAASGPLDAAELGREIDVNLKGVIHVANAMLPLLKTQPRSRLVNVGSGLGYVPLAAAPVYSATKAGVHSFTLALRRQLRDSPVQVVELIPPVVATDLHRHLEETPPMAMDLDAFVKAALAGLDAGRDEVVVGLAKVLRTLSRAAPSLGMKIVNQ